MKNLSTEYNYNLQELIELENEIALRDLAFDHYRKTDKSLWYGVGGGLIASLSILVVIRYLPTGILMTKDLLNLVKKMQDHIRHTANTTPEKKLTVPTSSPLQDRLTIAQGVQDQKQFTSTSSVSPVQNNLCHTELKNQQIAITPQSDAKFFQTTLNSINFSNLHNQYRFFNSVLNLSRMLNSPRQPNIQQIQNILTGVSQRRTLTLS